MNLQDFEYGLNSLGFTSGYVVGGNPVKILLWQNEEPKPSDSEIFDASKKFAYDRELEEVKANRHSLYVAPNGSDAIFLKYQRGEATKQEWLDAVQAINDAHPYPTK